MKKNESIVVTGGLGLIGFKLINKLLEDTDYEIICIDPMINTNIPISVYSERLSFIEKNDVRYCDIENLHFFNNIKYIFHLGALKDVGESRHDKTEYLKRNVEDSIKLIEKWKEMDDCTFIFFSSAAVYNNSISPIKEDSPTEPDNFYGMTKLFIENLLLTSEFNHKKKYIFRLSNVFHEETFGNDICAVLNRLNPGDTLYVNGLGEQIRDFININSIVDICKNIVENGKNFENGFPVLYNLSSGRGRKINELIKKRKRKIGEFNVIYYKNSFFGVMYSVLNNERFINYFQMKIKGI